MKNIILILLSSLICINSQAKVSKELQICFELGEKHHQLDGEIDNLENTIQLQVKDYDRKVDFVNMIRDLKGTGVNPNRWSISTAKAYYNQLPSLASSISINQNQIKEKAIEAIETKKAIQNKCDNKEFSKKEVRSLCKNSKSQFCELRK